MIYAGNILNIFIFAEIFTQHKSHFISLMLAIANEAPFGWLPDIYQMVG